jgi:hypothetical protein
MKHFLAMFLVLFVWLPTSSGGGAVITSSDGSGYALKADGLYYDGSGAAYTRETVWWQKPSVTYYGCRACTTYSWQSYYTFTPVPVPVLVTSADPEWRTRLLEIAATRDKYEARLRASSNEHNQFLESVRELGFSGNFAIQNYGAAPSLANPYRFVGNYQLANLQTGNFGAQGNTLYGYYGYNYIADFYGKTDDTILLQQAAALAKDGQGYAAQGVQGAYGLIDRAGARRAQVAEVIARGQTASQVYHATQPTGSAHVEVKESVTGPAPLPRFMPPADMPQPNPNAFSAVRKAAVQACIQCHGEDPKTNHGYSVVRHWSLQPEAQDYVASLLTKDPSDPKFMPRRQDGSPGNQLPTQLIMEFLSPGARKRVQ